MRDGNAPIALTAQSVTQIALDLKGDAMRIFYQNCARRLSDKVGETLQRDWLVGFVQDENIDMVCLAESSNYNFSDAIPDKFPKEQRWLQTDTELGRLGYKLNICSSIPVKYAPIDYSISHKSFDDGYKAVLTDYGTATCTAFIEHHVSQGALPVWQCDFKNFISQALARKLGFCYLGNVFFIATLAEFWKAK